MPRGNATPWVDHDITVQNMNLVGTLQPIAFYSYYPASDGRVKQHQHRHLGPAAGDPAMHTPNVYNITVNNLVATGGHQHQPDCRRARAASSTST